MWGQEGRDGDETSKPEGTLSRRVPGGNPTGLPGGAGNRHGQEGRRSEPLTYLPRAAGALEPPAVPGRGRQPGAAGLRGHAGGGGDQGPGPEAARALSSSRAPGAVPHTHRPAHHFPSTDAEPGWRGRSRGPAPRADGIALRL